MFKTEKEKIYKEVRELTATSIVLEINLEKYLQLNDEVKYRQTEEKLRDVNKELMRLKENFWPEFNDDPEKLAYLIEGLVLTPVMLIKLIDLRIDEKIKVAQ